MKRAALVAAVLLTTHIFAAERSPRARRRPLDDPPSGDESRPGGAAARRQCRGRGGRRGIRARGGASAVRQPRRRRLRYILRREIARRLDARLPRDGAAAGARTTRAQLPAAGARAAGVPGTVAGLHALHERSARVRGRSWSSPPRCSRKRRAMTRSSRRTSRREQDAQAGASRSAPAPELASTLQQLADQGASDFYEGDVAKKLVEGAKAAGGVIGFRDLADYKPVWRAPLKLLYGDYEIFTVPPPSGGGLVIGETLNILANDDLRASGFRRRDRSTCSSRRSAAAFIDRHHYVADPAGARIPYRELLSRHAGKRGVRPSQDRVVGTAMLSEPRDLAVEGEHTTHFTIADARGTCVPHDDSRRRLRQRLPRPVARLLPQLRNADFGAKPNAIAPATAAPRRSRRRSSSATTDRSWPSAPAEARRFRRRSCRSSSPSSSMGSRCRTPWPRRAITTPRSPTRW